MVGRFDFQRSSIVGRAALAWTPDRARNPLRPDDKIEIRANQCGWFEKTFQIPKHNLCTLRVVYIGGVVKLRVSHKRDSRPEEQS